MRKNNCPCKDCKVREVGCHETCENYTEWKTEITAEHELIKKEKRKEMDHDDFIRYAQGRQRRSHNHR